MVAMYLNNPSLLRAQSTRPLLRAVDWKKLECVYRRIRNGLDILNDGTNLRNC